MYLPFAITREERLKNDDPRPSVLERYPTRESYLVKMTDAALQLQAQGYLLPEDVMRILDKASKQNFWRNP